MKEITTDGLLEAAEMEYGATLTAANDSPENYPHIFFCDSEKGAKLVLKNHWFLNPGRAEAFEPIVAALCDAGISPPVSRTRDGRFFMRHGEQIYSMITRIETVPLDTSVHLELIAELIGRMHTVMAQFDSEQIVAPLFMETEQAVRALEEHGMVQPTGQLKLLMNRGPSVRIGMSHNDLHPGNFAVDRSGRAWILDYDSSGMNPLIGDIMFAAFRMTGGDRGEMERFVEAYERINPVTDEERTYRYHFLLRDFTLKVGFILEQNRQGEHRFMKDLERYESYVSKTSTFLPHESS